MDEKNAGLSVLTVRKMIELVSIQVLSTFGSHDTWLLPCRRRTGARTTEKYEELKVPKGTNQPLRRIIEVVREPYIHLSSENKITMVVQ